MAIFRRNVTKFFAHLCIHYREYIEYKLFSDEINNMETSWVWKSTIYNSWGVPWHETSLIFETPKSFNKAMSITQSRVRTLTKILQTDFLLI